MGLRCENKVMEEKHSEILKFSYKSSLIILSVIFLSLLAVPYVCNLIKIDYRIPTTIICGICSGFSTVYTQFFIERKKGFTKHFWIIGILISVFSSSIIFILVYTGKFI